MQQTKGILNTIKQHDKLSVKVSSDKTHNLPPDVLRKLLQPHTLDYYFFLFIDNGSTTCNVDIQELTLTEGQLLFVLPNQVFTPPQNSDDNLKYFKIALDENTLSLLPQQYSFLINPLNTQSLQFDAASKKRVKVIFEILDQLLHAHHSGQDIKMILVYLNTLLAEFETAYFKSNSTDQISNPKLSKYIQFKLIVETNLAEQHLIHSIADELSLTTNLLYGIVKEFSGVSPKEYITNRLMLEAQRKLYYSKLSAKEVAYELGFSDPDYFSKLFKKTTGKSIKVYLEDLQDLSGK